MITYEEYKDELRQVLRDVLCTYQKGVVENYIEGFIEDNERGDSLRIYFEQMMEEEGEKMTLLDLGGFAADVYMSYPDFQISCLGELKDFIEVINKMIAYGKFL